MVDNPSRAHHVCMDFLARASASAVHMALVPELAIPRETVRHIMTTVRDLSGSLVFLGGVEGLTRQEYASLLNGVGESQPLVDASTGGYVNSLLTIVKTPTSFVVRLRAKRVASRIENQKGPPIALGEGPFAILKPLCQRVLPEWCRS